MANYKIKITEPAKMTEKDLNAYENTLASRNGKKIVYVERFTTKAVTRKWGKVTTRGILHGNHIGYACKVKQGEKIVSYLVYNPNSDSTDDIVAVVTKGKIR